MGGNLVDQNNQKLVKAGSLIVDLSSMENGFHKEERRRQEIWDYIQYRESLLRWPSINKEVRKSG